jgi:hypothetical protein
MKKTSGTENWECRYARFSDIRISYFDFVWDFDIGIWDFTSFGAE